MAINAAKTQQNRKLRDISVSPDEWGGLVGKFEMGSEQKAKRECPKRSFVFNIRALNLFRASNFEFGGLNCSGAAYRAAWALASPSPGDLMKFACAGRFNT